MDFLVYKASILVSSQLIQSIINKTRIDCGGMLEYGGKWWTVLDCFGMLRIVMEWVGILRIVMEYTYLNGLKCAGLFLECGGNVVKCCG